MSIRTAQQIGNQLVQLRLLTEKQVADSLAQIRGDSPDALLRHLEGQLLLTPFQISKLVSGETKGYFVGRFRLLYRNASGTFARVFRAVDPRSDDVVAVKLLRDRHAVDDQTVRQFQREAELTASLRHPNIVRVIDVGIDADSKKPYIAMDFVEGGNLRELLRSRGRFEPHEVVRLGREMLEGLHYAMSRNITHRDLKLTNVLLSAEGHVKLVDFGLAGIVSGSANAHHYATELRTVDYAGLEMATGAPKGDPRSDIFFLGAIFYHMMTGMPALFESSDKKMRMLRTRFDRVPRLEGSRSAPGDLARIVDRMLEFRPEHRYQDYASLLRDLDAAKLSSPEENNGATTVTTANGSVGGPPRIVVIHKATRVQELLRRTLSNQGYQVVLTRDIQRALSLVELKPADCLIVDVDTVHHAGIDTLERHIRRQGAKERTAVVLLVSTHQVEWINGWRGPRTAILERPIKLGAIYRALKAFLPLAKKPTAE